MSWKPGIVRAWRCLVPKGLMAVLSGPIHPQLVRNWGLPLGSRFETLTQSWVELDDQREDRCLLDHLTAIAGPAITSRRVDLTALAFPAGVNPSINFDRLPLHTRTRNCLEKERLLA